MSDETGNLPLQAETADAELAPAPEKLSYTLESYLDAVYELSDPAGGGARLTDIARRMNVKKSTASAAMTSLAKRDLVEKGHYSHIRLTAAGEAMARGVTSKHETLFVFFSEVLGVQATVADQDACAIEHTISDEAVRAMRRIIGIGIGRRGSCPAE